MKKEIIAGIAMRANIYGRNEERKIPNNCIATYLGNDARCGAVEWKTKRFCNT